MNDRSGTRFSDAALEAALRDVGARLVYPPTVDLVPAVRARLDRRAGGGFWAGLRSPRVAFVPALATLALIAAAALAFQPVASSAAEALGLRGIGIFRTDRTPPPPPSASPSPLVPPSASPAASPAPRGVLRDAHLVPSADAASAEVGFRVLVPSALGAPDEIRVRVGAQDAQAFLVYSPRPGSPAEPAIAPSGQTGIGVLVTEVRGTFEFQLLGKLVGPGTKTEQVSVGGAPGVWIEGAPHQFFYRAPDGQFVQDTLRLAGNVLVYEGPGGVLVRIEADISKDRALAIAASIR